MRSLAAPSAATFEVAADRSAKELVGTKRRRATTPPRPFPHVRRCQRNWRTDKAAPAAETPVATVIAAMIAAIPTVIIAATTVDTAAPACATIDAALAAMASLARHGQAHFWHRHHRRRRRFLRPAAATAVTSVAAAAPVTIFAAIADTAERRDVLEGR